MQFIVKLLFSIIIIVAAVQTGKKLPALAGLIAAMPLTTLIVMIWMYSDDPGNYSHMQEYTRGVLWGLVPSALFFITAYLCLARKMAFPLVVLAGFAVWFAGAVVHQFYMRK